MKPIGLSLNRRVLESSHAVKMAQGEVVIMYNSNLFEHLCQLLFECDPWSSNVFDTRIREPMT